MYEELRDVKIQPLKKCIGGADAWYKTTATLDQVYKDGWWITEIFGSKAVLVREATYYECNQPRFCCVQRLIDLKTLTPKANRTIIRIQKQMWKKYERILLTPKDKRSKIRNKCRRRPKI